MTINLRHRIRIAEPAQRVHEALTDPAALRVWLAEHATVERPDRYEFWGRYTPDGAEPRQRLRHIDDRSLRFDWILDGETTTVEIALTEESDSSTLVTVTQTDTPGWPEMLIQPGTRSLMHTYWTLALANLADYVEGRDITPRADFTDPTLRGAVTIAADRQRVYESLTEPSEISRWSGVKVEAELFTGGRYAMGGFANNPSPACILDLQPGRSMTIDWGIGMVSSWELEDADGQTRLTFVQSGFDADDPPYDGWLGWLAGVAELRRYHERRDWQPMWVEVYATGLPRELLTIGD